MEARTRREQSQGTPQPWHRRVDRAAAYSPKTAGYVAGVVAIWTSPNKAIGTIILTSTFASDIASTWWDRYKKRKETRDEHR